MKYTVKQKAEWEKFLKDVETFKAITTAIKNFEDENKQALANDQALNKLRRNLRTLIGKSTDNYAEFKSFSILMEDLSIDGKYNEEVAREWLTKKSLPHQDYINERFARGEEKAQKALKNMPSKKYKNFVRGVDKLAFLLGSIMIAGIIVGVFSGVLFPVLTTSVIMLCIATACIVGGMISAFGGLIGAGITGSFAEAQGKKYNASLEKAQKTVDRAIVIEDTYNVLMQHGIGKEHTTSENLELLAPSEEINVPSLPKQQNVFFSIQKTLAERKLPALNAIQETEPLPISDFFSKSFFSA